jgi:hypothetical protein
MVADVTGTIAFQIEMIPVIGPQNLGIGPAKFQKNVFGEVFQFWRGVSVSILLAIWF